MEHEFRIKKKFDLWNFGVAYLISDKDKYKFCVFFPKEQTTEKLRDITTNFEKDIIKQVNDEDIAIINNASITHTILSEYVDNIVSGHDTANKLYTDDEDALFNVFERIHNMKLTDKMSNE